jgi:UDP-N-acetylmuramate dehydrogenase
MQKRLNHLCPDGVTQGIALSQITTWRIGGTADYLVSPANMIELQSLIAFLNKERIPFIVVGAGSNLLFSDKGLRGVVIRLGERFSGFEVSDQSVTVQAGLWAPCFSRRVASANLRGAEHIVGIPGSIGGLICMNGGSDRQSIGDYLLRVTSVNPSGHLINRKKEACDFGYRRSCFQENHEVVAEAAFRFPSGNYRQSRRHMLDILASRKKKFPLKQPNCGSVFVSNPEFYDQFGPPGKIIDGIGLKGKSIGRVRVSEKHANFIVHDGDANAKEVLMLVHFIRNQVARHRQIWLECEARYVSPEGAVLPLHQVLPERANAD